LLLHAAAHLLLGGSDPSLVQRFKIFGDCFNSVLQVNGDKFSSVLLRIVGDFLFNIGFLLNILHAIVVEFRNSVFVTLFLNMADTIEDIEKVQKLHSKRCCNWGKKDIVAKT